jgi:hypothetical protein
VSGGEAWELRTVQDVKGSVWPSMHSGVSEYGGASG